jgi:tetratricopeptide (TPR) repeat protein
MRETRELLSVGRSDDALENLRKALERDPQSQDLQTALEATQAKVGRERAEKQRLEQERQKADQLAREQAALEARLRLEAARQAIQQSQRLLQKGQTEEALQNLRKALEADTENQELRTALESAQSAVAHERAEKERLERERLAREKAEAEARARQAAVDEAMQQARSLLRDGEEDRAVDCLREASGRYPENNKLRAFLDTTQAEIARQRAERERLERERVAKEKVAAEARARQAAAEEAIRGARELQSKGSGDEALQQLRTALQRDPQNEELRAAFEATKATIERLRAEKERL